MTTSNTGIKSRLKTKKELGDTLYENIIQGTITNALTSTNSKKQADIDDVTHRATIIQNDVVIMTEDADKFPLDVKTHNVFDFLSRRLTNSFPHYKTIDEVDANIIDKQREITISLEEYMQDRNLSDVKTAREQLVQAVLTLYNTSAIKTETRKTRKGNRTIKEEITWNMRVIDTIGTVTVIDDNTKIIENGKVTVKFSFDFAKYLSVSPIMPYPTNIPKLNNKRNPHAYYLARKLTELYNMNKAKKNAGIVSVKTLLEHTPTLPTLEEVMSKDRHIDTRIIAPLEKDLDALVKNGILTSWEYCGAKGAPLTEEQKNTTYENMLSLYIKYIPNTINLPAPAPDKASEETKQ